MHTNRIWSTIKIMFIRNHRRGANSCFPEFLEMYLHYRRGKFLAIGGERLEENDR
jgi:hypothetical protein